MSIKKQQIIGLGIFIPGLLIFGFGVFLGSAVVFFSGLALVTVGGLIINPLSILG